MESDNNNALAFWYVASCVTHIGIGAVMRSSENQKAAYARAIGEYNKRFEAFTIGKFYGIDELAHVHVHPDKRSAVVLLFNLEDNEVERKVFLDVEAWGMADGALRASRDGDNLSASDSSVVTWIGPLECAIVDVEIE